MNPADAAGHVPSEPLDKMFGKAAVIEWLKHPVTKALFLVVAAEMTYQFILKRGGKALGLIGEAENATRKASEALGG